MPVGDLRAVGACVELLKNCFMEHLHCLYNSATCASKLRFFKNDQEDLEDAVLAACLGNFCDLGLPMLDLAEASSLVDQFIWPYAVHRIRTLLPALVSFVDVQRRILESADQSGTEDSFFVLDQFSAIFQPSSKLLGAVRSGELGHVPEYVEFICGFEATMKNLDTDGNLVASTSEAVLKSGLFAKLKQMGLPVFAAEQITWGELLVRFQIALDFVVNVSELDERVELFGYQCETSFNSCPRIYSSHLTVANLNLISPFIREPWNSDANAGAQGDEGEGEGEEGEGVEEEQGKGEESEGEKEENEAGGKGEEENVAIPDIEQKGDGTAPAEQVLIVSEIASSCTQSFHVEFSAELEGKHFHAHFGFAYTRRSYVCMYTCKPIQVHV